MNLGLLLVRVVVGALFVGHGTQKLFGWFNGSGLEGTAAMFSTLRYRRADVMARVAGASESTGGALLMLGLATPLAAAMIVGVMINAIVTVHLAKGPWNQNGGFEYPLVLATIATALAFTGAGLYSFDHLLGLALSGMYSGIWTLIVGGGGAGFVLMTRRPEREERIERRAA